MRRRSAASSRCGASATPTIRSRRSSLAVALGSRSRPTRSRATGATWLDRRLVEREPTPLAMGGFGGEVREAMTARAEHLVAEGLARRQGSASSSQRDLLDTLRRRELDAVAAKLVGRDRPCRTPRPRPASRSPASIASASTLASGRFAMIDDGLGFQLVPWSPSLEKQARPACRRRRASRRRHRLELWPEARAWALTIGELDRRFSARFFARCAALRSRREHA